MECDYGDNSLSNLGIGHRVLDGPPLHEPSPAINVSAILPPPLSVSPTH